MTTYWLIGEKPEPKKIEEVVAPVMPLNDDNVSTSIMNGSTIAASGTCGSSSNLLSDSYLEDSSNSVIIDCNNHSVLMEGKRGPMKSLTFASPDSAV